MTCKLILNTTIVALLLTVKANAADFERSFTVNGSPDLYVATGSGHVHITPGSDSQVHIKAHVSAGWNAGGDTEERIKRIVNAPPLSQTGNEIHVGDVSPEDRRLYNNITIDYEISAPKATALNLRSGSGDLEIDNLGRFLKAETGSGAVRAHGISGAADLHTGSGDIELQQQGAGDVKAATGSGSIRISGLSGGLTARTGSGDIEANGSLTGPAKLQSGSGSIRVHIGREAHFDLNATTGSGTIHVPGSSSSTKFHLSEPINGGGPALEAHTGSGDIEIN